MGFIPLSEVIVAEDASLMGEVMGERVAGGYNPTHGILLNAQELNQKPALTLWTLIHEELHAISITQIKTKHNPGELPLRIDVQKLGVLVKTVERVDALPALNRTKFQYGNFNEGITELLSEKIFNDYLIQSGDTERFGYTEAEKERAASYSTRTYSRYRQAVDVYTAVLSITCEIPQDKAEEGVIRAYLRNGDILPQEFVEALDTADAELLYELHLILREPKKFSLKISTHGVTNYEIVAH